MAKIKNDEEFFAVIDSVAQSAARIDTLKARLNEAKIALNLEWGTRIEEVEKPHRAEFNRAKKYALDHRDRLLGGEKSAQTKAATWGFKDNRFAVIPIFKATDEEMVKKLLTLPGGMEYLSVNYKLVKSKIADGIQNNIAWIKELFQLTKSEVFFADKIKDKTEGA